MSRGISFKARPLTFFSAAVGWLVLVAVLTLGNSARAYTYKVLYDFCSEQGCRDGAYPAAGLVRDSAGHLYGTANQGGASNAGTVFRLDFDSGRNKWKFNRLWNFCSKKLCKDGANPFAPLIIDTAGTLYGTTHISGGKKQGGSIFRLPPSRSDFSVIHELNGDSDGTEEFSGLTYTGAATGIPYDGSSPLYGDVLLGGEFGDGVAFMLQPKGTKWHFEKLYDFCALANCADGAAPQSELLADHSGNLFGVTQSGGLGTHGGTVFELTPNGPHWHLTTLYRFCALRNCADGSGPRSPLVKNAQGNLLGTAEYGGTKHGNCCGAIFQEAIDGDSFVESTVYNFCSKADCADGSRPQGTLITDTMGNLIGTTTEGGGNDIDISGRGGGVIYRFDGVALNVLYSFCSQSACADGVYPQGGVIMDENGNLFGTTFLGGKSNSGVVFELSP